MSGAASRASALAAVGAATIAAAGMDVGTAAAADRIAVARESGGLVLVDVAGRPVRTLTRHAGWADTDPAWSPDGRRIAFTRTKDGDRSFQVYVMRADGTGVRRITRGRFDWRPAWSPDGRWIAFQSATGIRVVRPDGRGARAVGRLGADAAWPSWTPAGRLSVFDGGWVRIVRLDGVVLRRLVQGRDAHWSPDGRSVVYTPPDGGVATLPAGGGASRSLGRGYQPDWSPDGARIVYSRMRGTTNDVWVMDRDGGGAHRIVRGAQTPAWRP